MSRYNGADVGCVYPCTIAARTASAAAQTLVWTLTARALKIPTYGKNYNTGRYTTYAAIYDKCKNDQ